MKITKILDTLSQSKFLISKIIRIKNGKKYIILKFVLLICNSCIDLIGILVPGLLINELIFGLQTEAHSLHRLALYLAILLVLPFVYRLFLIPLQTLIWKMGEELGLLLTNEFNVFVSKMDYETLEVPEMQEWRERVDGTVQGSLEIVDMAGNILKALISLFVTLSIITYLNPLLIVLIVAMIFINSLMTRWMNGKRFALRKDFSKRQRRIWSLSFMLGDFSFAKEVRLYQAVPMLLDKLNDAKRDLTKTAFQNHQNENKVSLVLRLTEFVQSAVIYVYMIYKVLFRGMPIGSMTIYLSASQQFSGAVSTVVNSYLALSERSMEIKEWRDFLKIPAKNKDGALEPQIHDDFYIEFRNVSFQYPGSDTFALQNLSLKISCHEKLCIVGVNGSGKSTFIKLLLRLYEPTSGEILLNDININDYDYELYQQLFAPVFQDFALFEFTLKENIVLAETYVEERFRKVCDDTNISSLFNKLTKGAETQIGKEIEPDGIEPSGGEGQRIAIARACYHGGEILVLDEPTAALDPNAEYEIYTQFYHMIIGKCAVIVTHRLSAVQLVDKVAVFNDGQVVEYGTHAELYAKGGLYTEMFDKQAQFYRDNPVSNENDDS